MVLAGLSATPRRNRNKAHVAREAEKDVDHIKALQQLVEMRRFVGGFVRARQQREDVHALDADLLAHRRAKVARELCGQFRDRFQQQVRLLIDR